MFRIGEFLKMSKVAVKTLRYYDEVDLLKPEHIDPETSYRFYTTDHLARIDFLCSGDLEEAFMNYQTVIKETQGGIIYAKKMILRNYMNYFSVIPPLGEAVTTLNSGN